MQKVELVAGEAEGFRRGAARGAGEIIRALRENTLARLGVIGLRVLLGIGFIPSGMVKILGERFTKLPTTTPIGYFFEALYQSGVYWNFIGVCQVVAALLLMTQRYATLGALLFLPIIVNIFVITVSLGFSGTPVITFLMLCGTLLLLVWDYEKFQPLFANKSHATSH